MTDEGEMTPEQEEWLWTYLDAVEKYALRAWMLCGGEK